MLRVPAAQWPRVAQGGGEDPTQTLATVFVWLRYSAARQLTWQRNYNTQPRILGDAQARLTATIAQARGRAALAACVPSHVLPRLPEVWAVRSVHAGRWRQASRA